MAKTAISRRSRPRPWLHQNLYQARALPQRHQIQSLMFGQQHDFNSDLSGPRRSEKWEDGAKIAVVGLPVYNNLKSMTNIYSLALYTTRNLRLRLVAKSANTREFKHF